MVLEHNEVHEIRQGLDAVDAEDHVNEEQGNFDPPVDHNQVGDDNDEGHDSDEEEEEGDSLGSESEDSGGVEETLSDDLDVGMEGPVLTQSDKEQPGRSFITSEEAKGATRQLFCEKIGKKQRVFLDNI